MESFVCLLVVGLAIWRDGGRIEDGLDIEVNIGGGVGSMRGGVLDLEGVTKDGADRCI